MLCMCHTNQVVRDIKRSKTVPTIQGLINKKKSLKPFTIAHPHQHIHIWLPDLRTLTRGRPVVVQLGLCLHLMHDKAGI